MRQYVRTPLESILTVQSIITLFYFEFGNQFVFRGETHNFWELLYVDRGSIEVVADDRRHLLEQGSIIFHKPNEFHAFHALHGKALNVLVITFDCYSPVMSRFENQILALDDKERNLVARLLEEGRHTFQFPFQYPLGEFRQPAPPIGSEQLFRLYLETLLVMLLRKMEQTSPRPAVTTTAKLHANETLAHDVIRFLGNHLDTNVSLSDIADALHVSKTVLKQQFRQYTGSTIKEYFIQMKVDQAKVLIREQPNNFTEIAQMLGFSSVHYFSKVFKDKTGMPPSAYAKSIIGRVSSEA